MKTPTVQEIRDWVLTRPSEMIVGYCGSPYECVIATYLRECHPDWQFAVQLGNERIVPFKGVSNAGDAAAPVLPLPFTSALSRMASDFDHLKPRDYNVCGNPPVTAQEMAIYLRDAQLEEEAA